MPTKKPELADIELHPDAWERFERFVKGPVAGKAVPKTIPSRPKAATRKTAKKA